MAVPTETETIRDRYADMLGVKTDRERAILLEAIRQGYALGKQVGYRDGEQAGISRERYGD